MMFDFAEFKPLTMYLCLIVFSAAEDEAPIGGIFDKVACPIHSDAHGILCFCIVTSPFWIFDEGVGGLCFVLQVTLG